MPLSINVGLSRKASRDYQSAAVSINIVAELDQSLLAKPDELQKQIDGLYQQAQSAIDRNAAAPEPAERDAGHDGHGSANWDHNGDRKANRDTDRHGRNGNTAHNGYGSRSGNGKANGNGGSMTDSQRRAILAIAKRANADVDYECREMIGAEFEDLTLRQASELIDHLKAVQPANGRGNGR